MTAQTPPRTINHGTQSGYVNGKCRCERCRVAHRTYQAGYRRRNPRQRDSEYLRSYEAMRDLLHELFPDGLTDDAPNRRAKQAA